MKSISKIYATLLAIALTTTGFTSAAEPPNDLNYNLAKAEVVDQVILSVIENYYDPARIDSRAMFKAAVDTLQKSVAEVKADFESDEKQAVVDILGKKLKIDLDELTSPWRLSRALHRVFQFLEEHLPRKEYNFSDLEYAMANGMLTVLDPHSNVLPPDIYESLRMDTAGEFGGLGVRITTDRRPPCSGYLTVVAVFENTPASKVGLKNGDQITRIDNESTVNITTAEAAKRLRGTPGSIVKLEIRRTNGQTKKIDIRRETVPIISVKWELLPGKVGYISLEQFQGNSARELEKALAALQVKGMKGLVLDLRGNPGGLLDIAIQIVDYFLDSGTIVATAGRRGKYDQSVRNASPSGTQPDYPLVVLIDGGSASAAEIMAGALRNHGRALLVGETTFGKGSVQMVQPLSAGGALKLTSAQYLTPGDISIQAVGVSPNITFVPFTVDKKDTDWGHLGLAFSEADLEYHLDRPTARRTSDRDNVVKAAIYVPPSERETDRARFERCFVNDEDLFSFQDRYEIEFARRLVASFKGETTDEMLLHAKEQIKQDELLQSESIRKALKKLGVTWSGNESPLATTDDKPSVSGKVRASAKLQGSVYPGRPFKIKLTVKNSGNKPIRRLRATTKSDNYLFDGLDFVFGDLKQGKRKNWSTTIELPPSASARTDMVKVSFKSDEGPVPAPIDLDIDIPTQPLPHLAYNWQFEDLTNSNGIVEPGEEVRVHVTVKNMGPGSTVEAQADLSGKPGVDIVQGRFNLGKLKPGDTVDGVFSLRVSKKFDQNEAPLDLVISDYIPARILTSRNLLHREIEMQVLPPSPGPDRASGTVTIVKSDKTIPVFESPSLDSRTVALAPSGASFALKGLKGKFFQIALSKNRNAWIKRSDTSPGGKEKPNFTAALIEPPVISITGDQVLKVSSDKILVQGKVIHPSRVRDLMIFVGDRKLLYETNTNSASNNQMSFKIDVPLEDGSNYITIVARHDDKTVSSLPVFVRRIGDKN